MKKTIIFTISLIFSITISKIVIRNINRLYQNLDCKEVKFDLDKTQMKNGNTKTKYEFQKIQCPDNTSNLENFVRRYLF